MRVTVAVLATLVVAIAAIQSVSGAATLIVPKWAEIKASPPSMGLPNNLDIFVLYGIGGLTSEDAALTVLEGFAAPALAATVNSANPNVYAIAHGMPGGKAMKEAAQLAPNHPLPDAAKANFAADGKSYTGTEFAQQVWAGLGKPAPAAQFNGLTFYLYFCFGGRGSDVNQKLITDFQQEFQKHWKKSFTVKANRGPSIINRAKHLPFKTEVVKPLDLNPAAALQNKLLAEQSVPLKAAATALAAGAKTLKERGVAAYANPSVQAFYTAFLDGLTKGGHLEPDQKKAIQTKKAADRSGL